jgi:hypothetical protein
MNLEIHTPALEERVRAQIQSGHFQNTDELLTKALDALEEKETTATVSAPPVPYQRPPGRKSLVELFADSPWKGLDLDFSRNRTPSRPVELA